MQIISVNLRNIRSNWLGSHICRMGRTVSIISLRGGRPTLAALYPGVPTFFSLIPSQDEIARLCRINKGTVSRRLRKWEGDGLVSRAQEGAAKVVASA